MVSLADEVKALVAMGIPPAEALAAVTADRERNGNIAGGGLESSSSTKKEVLSVSLSSPKRPEDSSNSSTSSPSKSPVSPARPSNSGSSSRLEVSNRPLSYNRPGMIKHTQNDEIDVLPALHEDDELFNWITAACGLTDAEAAKICRVLSAERIDTKAALVSTLNSNKAYFISGESKLEVKHGKALTAQLREEGLVVAPTRSTVGDAAATARTNQQPPSQRSSAPLVSNPLASLTNTRKIEEKEGRRERPEDRTPPLSPNRDKKPRESPQRKERPLRDLPPRVQSSRDVPEKRGRPNVIARSSSTPKENPRDESSAGFSLFHRSGSIDSPKNSPKNSPGTGPRHDQRNTSSMLDELVEFDSDEDEDQDEDEGAGRKAPSGFKMDCKKFLNKADSNGALESQRTLTAEFSSENSFLPLALLPLKEFQRFWRNNMSTNLESVSIDSFLAMVQQFLTQEEKIHKSEAKLCVSSVKRVLERLDLNGNNQVSLMQLRLFLKPYGVEMSMFDAFLKLRARDGSSLLFLAPALPARYIPLQSSVDANIESAMAQHGFTRVLGPAHAGKSTRILAACHLLPADADCLWIDFTAEITTQACAVSQLAAELGLAGEDNFAVLRLFRKLLSKLAPNSVVVFDQIDTTECATACSAIFSICAEHHLSFIVISRTTPVKAEAEGEGEGSTLVPSIPFLDGQGKECRTIHIGPLSAWEASQMATVFSDSDSELLSEYAEFLPGNILALGTLSSTYFKQLAAVAAKKNPHAVSNEATDLLMRSLDEAQRTCAHCLAPLLHMNAYVSEECMWFLCEEAFEGNKAQWSDAMNGLERMGWLRASLSTDDFMVTAQRLPPKDNAPALFKQCARYCDFWAKQLNLMFDAHQSDMTTTSLFHFDRYRSHFNRLLDCWGQAGGNSIHPSLAAFGLLGSNHARDVAFSVAGKVGVFCAKRLPPPECVDICCDIFTIVEHHDKQCVTYLLASLDLARMLLLNGQLFDGLELSTELVAGVDEVLPKPGDEHHFLLGSSLGVLAQVYEALGQNENAIVMYNRSIDSLGIFYGLESRQFAIAEHSLGHVHRFINDLKKAELCYKKALERFKSCHGRQVDHEDISCVLNDLAGIYKMRDEGDLAYDTYMEVLRIRQKVLGNEHIETANTLNNLAVLLHAEGKYDEAKSYYQDALVIYKELLGDLDSDVAASLNNLGALHDDVGDFEEARSYYESSLAIRRAVLSDDHPDLAASLGNLAALLDDNGDIDAAKELYLQTLAVSRNIYGNNHVDIASTLVNIAALEDEQGNLAEAKGLYEEALAIFIGLYTENNADVASTMTCLANVAKLQHDHPTVRQYYDRVLVVYKELHGVYSVEVANAMTSYGVYLFKNGTTNMGDDSLHKEHDGGNHGALTGALPLNGDTTHDSDVGPGGDEGGVGKHSSSATVQLYEASSKLLEEALHIRREILGPRHVDIVASLKNIGWLRKVQRQFPSAVESYEEALSMCEKMYNRHHPEVAECLTQLGILNKFQNKFKDAISFFEEAIRIYKTVTLKEKDKKTKKKYALLTAANFSSLAIVHKSMRNYEDAVESYKECFEIQFKELGNDNAEVAKTLHALGLVTWYLGNVQTARKLLEEALDIRRRVLPARHPDIIQSLNNLADLLGEDHKYNESMRKYADAIARIEQTVGPDHPDLAVDLLNMALMAYEMGKYNEAIPLFERGLSIRIKAFGDDHELVAEYLLAIANLHVAQRQFRDSKFEFEGGLTIIEKKLGRQSREYAIGLSHFGKCLQLQCQFKEAIPVVNESLVIFRSAVLSAEAEEAMSVGERNVHMLDLTNILIIGADVFVGCGDYAAAEPYYEEAIEILQKVLGDDNIQVANVLMKLASVFKNQQYYDDAKHVYQEVLQIRRQCLGVHLDVVQVLNNLGDLCKRLGELDGALMYFEEALVIREQLLGEFHQDVAQSVHAVAAIYDLQEDFAEAERLFERALVLRRKCLGDMHPDVAQTLNNLAAILDDLNRSDEAEPYYREALLIYKEVYGDQHPDVALSLNNLAALLDDNGEFDAALKLYDEALVITKKIYGEGSLDVASAQICLANALQHLKRFLEAEALFQHALDIKIHNLGEEHLDVATTKVMYAELFVDEGEMEDAKYLLMEAMATRENLLGADHPDVVKLRERIEELERRVQHLMETEGEMISHADGSKRLSIQTIHSMEVAVKLKQDEVGREHVLVADLLVQLANALTTKDRYHDALERLQEALRIFRVNYSSEHPLVIVTLDKVISVLSCINEFEAALPLLLEVIETKSAVYGEASASLGDSLAELGFIYDRLGQLQKASEVYKQSLAIKRITAGNNSVDVGQALNNLAAILDDLGNSVGAEPYYREGIEIYKHIYGSEHADVALSLNNLAALLDDRGDYSQAKVYYEEALDITKKLFGEGSMEVAAALICVARTMKSLMQYEAAASYYDAAAQIKETVLGPITSDVALLYDQVGSMYVKLKWFEMGVNVYGKAYSIRQQIFGDNHPQLAQSLELMAGLQEAWGRPGEAVSLLEEAVDVLVGHHGGNRVVTDIADILVKLAALARKNRKPRSALPYLNEALATYRACYGSKHGVVATTLCSIASIYKGFHKYNEAINISRKAMLIREAAEGETSAGVAEVIVSMGSIREKQKQYDEAQSHYEDALRMYNMLHEGAPHADTAQTLTSLALVLKLQRKFDEAKDHYERALEMRRALHPTAPHPDIAQAMNNLAAVLYSRHEYTEAKVLYEDSLQMLIELLGTENLDVAQAMNNLAALLFAKKNHREAEPLYEESLCIRRRLLGSDHLDVASSLCNLGILKRSLREYDEAAAFFEESLTIRMKILNDDSHPDILVCKKHLAFLKQLTIAVKVGMRVEVSDRSSGKQLMGTVVKEHDNDVYDIKFDDTSKKVAGNVPRSRITVHPSLAEGATAIPPSSTLSRKQQEEEEEGEGAKEKDLPESPTPRDRATEDFLRAGNKIVRKNKSVGSSKSTGSSSTRSEEVSSSGGGRLRAGGGRAPHSRLQVTPEKKSPVAPQGDGSTRSASPTPSVDSTKNSSMSSNSGSALNQILEQTQSRPVSSPPKQEQVAAGLTSPGFTKLKSRREAFQDENNTTAGNKSGSVHHTSFQHKSSKELSVSSEGVDDDSNNNTSTKPGGGGSGGDSKARSRYRESVGTAGFRRSNKSFYKNN